MTMSPAISAHPHPERRRVVRRITTRGGNASGCGERLSLKTGWAFGLSLFWAAAAMAESHNLSGSLVTMQDTARPGALAEVELRNIPNNGEHDNGSFELTHNGITVTVTFTWNAFGSPDQIEVEAPEGFVAVPPVIEVDEHSVGTIYIFSGQPGV